MSLPFAILGHLSTTPATGYELAQQFREGLGAWFGLPSQIYPELKKLEEKGLIKGESSTEDRLNKRIYRLTQKGERELQRWVDGPVAYKPPRDPERVQFILMDRSSPENIRKHLLRHRAHFRKVLTLWQAQLDALADGSHPRLKPRLAGRPKSEHALIIGLKVAGAEGNLKRAECEIEWANKWLAWLDTLHRK
jgi:PadR family transcriptional regulator, regulatory protein AphA